MEKTTQTEMVSVARCKSFLEKDGSSYTTDEVLMIRDFLYMLADHEFSAYLKEKRRDIECKKTNDESQLKIAA